MAWIKFFISFFITAFLSFLLTHRPGSLPFVGKLLKGSPAAAIPALGTFLSPFHGIWQNAEHEKSSFPAPSKLKGLKSPAKVVFDKRLVPHIFADNDSDMYFLQGFITATYRLWQMEFITHAAAGRLSEIIGERGLENDLEMRRTGMVFGAQNAIDFGTKNPTSKAVLESFTAGVNAYINSLSDRELPIEYKLLGYEPELWSPLKSSLLNKQMARDLASREFDLEHTNALLKFGNEVFDELFPNFVEAQDPIVPFGSEWNFQPLKVDTAKTKSKEIESSGAYKDSKKTKFSQETDLKNIPKEDPILGSNNWTVHGKKTVSEFPILANDPHLQLNLPAIWFELQMSSPSMNTYGVSLPGAPGIVIGFNKSVAWGVTNAGRDVKDWYVVQYNPENKNQYRFEDEWRNLDYKIEEIKVRGQAPIFDTVAYTHYGPIAKSIKKDGKDNDLALRWAAHDPSNELMTFYKLNRAQNYDDYISALDHYQCPAQNFIFADVTGNIAIKQQGKFPVKWENQGKFFLDGTKEEHQWQKFIPNEHNAHSKNPERGYLSSANQHPTDSTYPYWYNMSYYEMYRNRRLNQQLSVMNDISPADMKQLQLDNYNLHAAETLPSLLQYIDTTKLDKQGKLAFKQLMLWDYVNNPEVEAASVFEAFWNALYALIWDEIKDSEEILPYPNTFVSSLLLTTKPQHPFMDIANTEQKETAKELCNLAFAKAVQELKTWSEENNNDTWKWASFKGSKINHLLQIPAFGIEKISIGGNKGILNASTEHTGPSWRMVVALGKTTEAWGIYPGGQSGNPGSPYYSNFVDDWAKGDYYRLHFMANASETILDDNLLMVEDFSPK